jgi:pre-mRNA-splicing factor ATP-dependent RNA helicase DHX15/PRP43
MERKRSRSPRAHNIRNPYTHKDYSNHYFKLLSERQNLPVYEALPQLEKLIGMHQIIILQGETGSGKTTQVPQYLAKLHTRVACTQPRRVAAISVAKRVAEEMDVKLGNQVGYSVRFDECSSEDTILKYLTDGMLLREAMKHKNLDQYQIIILDEAHERTLATDILFGLMKEVLKRRPDLKLIIMSATLNAQRFQEYFDGAPLLSVPGRLFPVEVFFTQVAEEDYVAAAVKTVLQIHAFEDPGDILLFLTGEEEIETACRNIKKEVNRYGESVGKLSVVPLYSSLPPSSQQKIFEPAPGPNSKNMPGRKCIVATNIAETSLTIDGIVYVVDSGLSKQKTYNPRMRVESLVVAPISKASAKQRAGRAGRTRPGKCYRLYTEETYRNELQETAYPEILRSNLTSTVLTLRVMGIENLVNFDFMDPPVPETMMRALEILNYLGALDDEGEVTQTGVMMVEFPLGPELSKILITSQHYQCSEDILTLCAVLSVPNPFLRPKDAAEAADKARKQFAHQDGDHLTLINLFQSYIREGQRSEWCSQNFINPRSMKAASEIRDQLLIKYNKLGLTLLLQEKGRSENIRKCITSGFFMQVANKEKNNFYMTLKEKQIVAIHPSTTFAFRPEWVLYHEYILTSKNYIRTVSVINPLWLLELAPHYYNLNEFPDSQGKRQLEKLKKAKKGKRLN